MITGADSEILPGRWLMGWLPIVNSPLPPLSVSLSFFSLPSFSLSFGWVGGWVGGGGGSWMFQGYAC